MAKTYKSKCTKIAGRNYLEKERRARKIYEQFAKSTKRKAYIRSAYFDKEKVFLKTFWEHLYGKKVGDRERRVVYYAAALDLVKHSKLAPDVTDLDRGREIYYRFYGTTKGGEEFVVQIRQDKEGGKYHMSVFPVNKKSR